MERLKRNQILVEVSADKKKVTIQSGVFCYPITFDSCPAKVTENLGNAVNAYIEQTGLENIPEWESEMCGYEGGTGTCRDCN